MSRQYTVTENVGRPSKYSEHDFKDIINKEIPDIEFAKKFDVSVGTIAGIRTNQSKKLNIPTKDKHKNQTYAGKKMPYNHNEYHKKYQADNTKDINKRRRELYQKNKAHVLEQKAKYRAEKRGEKYIPKPIKTTEGTKMPQNNGESVDLIDHEINIDDYVKVTLSIPKKLTAIELKGIMIKANQLLKMSEVTVMQGPGKHYKQRRAVIEWKDSLVQELVNVMQTRGPDTSKVSVMRTFGEKHDMSSSDVSKRYYYLMGHNLLPKSNK